MTSRALHVTTCAGIALVLTACTAPPKLDTALPTKLPAGDGKPGIVAPVPRSVEVPKADLSRRPSGTPGALPTKEATATIAPPAPDTDLGTAFATRYARFEPVGFDGLPGWTRDSIRDSLSAFKQSCLALGKKPIWQDLCADAGRLDGADDTRSRTFFEQNFHAYSMLNPDSTDEGIITGYYEPLLEGSRTRSVRYPYPVHGIPADLLFIDAQTVAGGNRMWLQLADRRLVPAAANIPGARQYTMAMDGLTPGVRDKRYRVRIDGDRVVPYWTRQAIERRELDAQALAWVNDAYALYSMQIQGSGKIRLAGGEIIRVAYGEQNGHPFLPQATASDTSTVASAIKTRGLTMGGASAAATSSAAAAPVTQRPTAPTTTRDPEVARLIAGLQGGGDPRPAPAASVPASPRPVAPSTAKPAVNNDVAAIIAALSGKPPPPSAAAPAQAPRPAVASASPAGAGLGSSDGAGAPSGVADGRGTGSVTGIPDPSYVFFRLIPDSPQGPLGALGVPLTAGRSIAVDPRTTPLGYPVFVSTTSAESYPGGSNAPPTAVNRLMFAQDTGGAIRGSVRADYFWGFGPSAGNRAASMKETGRMWLLLPRKLETSTLTASVRTRSLGPAAPLPECVVADPDNCVED